MDWTAVGKLLASVLVPLAAVVGVGSRRRRLRSEIRENLALIKELEADDVIHQHTPATSRLQGKVTMDVARLAGVPLGTRKKPIAWGSLITAAILSLLFGAWTWYIDRNGFVWYSVFPGVIAGLLAISFAGMLTDRELPPESEDCPKGQLRSELGVTRNRSSPRLAYRKRRASIAVSPKAGWRG